MAITRKVRDKGALEIRHGKRKLVDSTLPTNYKLSKEKCPKSKTEKAEMTKVPYALEVRSLMYAMI